MKNKCKKFIKFHYELDRTCNTFFLLPSIMLSWHKFSYYNDKRDFCFYYKIVYNIEFSFIIFYVSFNFELIRNKREYDNK